MAKTKWNLLFATFVLSCASLAVLIVAFSTPYWLSSEAYEKDAYRNSDVNYGLFTGSLTQNFLPNPRYYDLTLVCLYDEYVCAFSCQQTSPYREDELQRLLLGLAPQFECPLRTGKSASIARQATTETASIQSRIADKGEFINFGLWISTVVFLSIATGMAAVSASFSIVNVLFNPVEPIFSVFGLYIWNGITVGATVLCLIMWGSLYAAILSDNIAITDTLTPSLPYSSTDLASLGASYWILFVPLVLHGSNIGLLLWRQYIINREPPPTTIDVDRSDLTIIMY